MTPPSGHPEADELRRFQLGERAAPGGTREHVDGCADCQAELERLSDLARVAAPPDSPCPDTASLVALADEELDADARATTARHVERCADCAGVLARLAEADEAVGLDPGAARPASAAARLLDALRHLVDFQIPEPALMTARSAAAAPASTDAELGEALRLLAAGDADEAARRLRTLRDDGDDSAEVAHFLGCALVAAGRPAEAIEPLRAASRSAPRLTQLRFHLAQALLLAGDVDEGLASLDAIARKKGGLRHAAADLAARVRELHDATDPDAS